MCIDKTQSKPNGGKVLQKRLSIKKTTHNLETEYKTEQLDQYANFDEHAKKIEQRAVEKLGIQSIQELLDYFEENEKEKFKSMYKIIRVLGSGGFGVVLQGIDIKHRKNIALKVVFKGDIKGEMLIYEYQILKELHHPNIIKIYSLLNFTEFYIMVMKLTKENLSQYASRKRRIEKQPLTEEECALIMRGIFQGLEYLHEEKNIIHRDLKPDNILIGSYSDLTQCKIIDFGIASQNKKENLKKFGRIGTLIYQPPEQATHKFHYGKGADIWAAGIIAYKIITGKHPFVTDDDNMEAAKMKILEFKEITFTKDISPQAKHLIERLCTKESSQRYSAAEALTHPWITRDLKTIPPMTKFERKNLLGEELMIETKLRNVQSMIYFMSILQIRNRPKTAVVDIKYKYRLKAQEMPQISKVSRKQTLHSRVIVPPSISIEKTSSLYQKEQNNLKNLNIQKQMNSADGNIDDLQHDFISFSNSVNMEVLSPDIKDFLRKNRIRIRKGAEEKSERDSSSKSKKDSKLRKNSDIQYSQIKLINEVSHLNVPVKMRGKTISDSQSDRSSSGGSPRELNMSVASDQFSDLDTSNEDVKDLKPKAAQIKPTATELPEISSKKQSIQQKNNPQQPKEILNKIKHQRAEVRDLRIGQKVAQMVTGSGSSEIEGKQAAISSSAQGSFKANAKKRMAQAPIASHIASQDTLTGSGNPSSLVKMMQEQIKQEEEKRKTFGKIRMPQQANIQKRAASSHGTYKNIYEQRHQQAPLAGGLVTFDFNSIAGQKINYGGANSVTNANHNNDLKFSPSQNIHQYMKQLQYQ